MKKELLLIFSQMLFRIIFQKESHCIGHSKMNTLYVTEYINQKMVILMSKNNMQQKPSNIQVPLQNMLMSLKNTTLSRNSGNRKIDSSKKSVNIYTRSSHIVNLKKIKSPLLSLLINLIWRKTFHSLFQIR